jgi:hypothetical protein
MSDSTCIYGGCHRPWRPLPRGRIIAKAIPGQSKCRIEPPRSFAIAERSIDRPEPSCDRNFKPLVLGQNQSDADTLTFACAVRAQWGVDVIFRGDQARFRTGDGPQNIAIIRHTTLRFHVLNQPPVSNREERRLSGNRHPSDRLTFKRFPCLGERVDMEPDHIGGS